MDEIPAASQWNEFITNWIPRLAREVLSAAYTSPETGRLYSCQLCEGSDVVTQEGNYHVYLAEFDVCGTRTGLVEYARFPKMILDPDSRFRGMFKLDAGFVYTAVLMRIAHNVPLWKIDPTTGHATVQIRSQHPDKLGRSTCTLTYDCTRERYALPFIKQTIPRAVLHDALRTRNVSEISELLERDEEACHRLLRHEVLPHLGANPLDKLVHLQETIRARPAVSTNVCDMRFVEFESVAVQYSQLIRQTFTRCSKFISRALIRRAASAELATARPTRAEALRIANFAPVQRAIQRGLSTGKWELRQGVTHRLVTMNDMMIEYQRRRVHTTYLNSRGRVVEPRMLHAVDRTDYTYGYLCAVNSADGKDCGLTLELASTAVLRGFQLLRPVRLLNGKVVMMAHNKQLALGTYTEVDPQAYLGVCARQAPFSNHDQGPRTILGCVMSRQMISADTIHPEAATVYQSDYAQRTLAPIPDHTMTNVVVAVMQIEDNEDDGCAVSQRFVDFGGLYCSVTKTVRKRDPETLLREPRQRSAQGWIVVGGEKLSDEVKLRDEFTGLAVSETDTAIRIRTRQRLAQGDKVSNLHGQKSTIARVIPAEDMPFSVRTGMSPDVVINPAALSSRMTCGMLLEMLAGTTAAIGRYGEKLTATNCKEALRACGLTSNGCERFCDGTTGRLLEGEIFVGLIAYGRMEQIAGLKSNLRATGPRDPMTRQPLAGRSKDGAPKAGPMEIDAMVGHGATAITRERTCLVSDQVQRRWCKLCAIEVHGAACAHCRDPKNTRIITVPTSTMVLRNELQATGVMMKCLLRDLCVKK